MVAWLYIFNPAIDTYAVSYMLWFGDSAMPNIKLASVAQKMSVDMPSAHRAMADVQANTEIFRKMMIGFANMGGKIANGKVSIPQPPPNKSGGKQRRSKYKCPDCDKGYLVVRTAKKGRNAGSEFYGCTNYPRCTFACNTRVVSQYEMKK